LHFDSVQQYKSSKDPRFSHMEKGLCGDAGKAVQKSVTAAAIPLFQMYACGLRYANAMFAFFPAKAIHETTLGPVPI
jgi:hypothetical protein